VVGILLNPTAAYASKKSYLSPKRLEALELAEEAIAADPNQARIAVDGISYDFSDDFVAIAFRRTSRNEGELIGFKFYDEA